MVSDDEILRAADALKNGELVVFPTETVYGLGGDARDSQVVARIFSSKGRPSFNPLIVHVADLQAAKQIGKFNDVAVKLADAFWPGPLTLVVQLRGGAEISSLVTAGLDSIALRVPGHPVALALLKASGLALAAPSANRSGRVSPTEIAHVQEEGLENIAMMLDGGACDKGIESTIIKVEGEKLSLLRPGSVSAEQIEEVTGLKVISPEGSFKRPQAPGNLASHYAPNAELRLDVEFAEQDEGVIAFGSTVPQGGAHIYNLSEEGDLVEAAQKLYAALRFMDNMGVSSIAVAAIPKAGVGLAIYDRLQRAAAPREVCQADNEG